MALYDGFFDGIEDGVHEDGTTKYDREYESSDFTNYFGQIVGSGVCIHDNPDSFKAEFEDGVLYLRPGYLFIRGYWLANVPGEDGDPASYKGYVVTLPAAQTGPVAVVAHLNLGQKIIEIETRSVSQAYPDSLVLAIVDVSAAEDTRHNTDICGVIDSAGALSGKAEYAINYINNEIDRKLEQIEQDIAEHELKLDAKIAEAQAVVDKIEPPPVGTIKFSASQDVGEEWLRCDGSFVNEQDYPELVAALGKLTPSADKFQVISDNEIGTQISNGVVYGGRMWVYSYATKKLYGVDLEGTGAVKEISVESDDESFGNFVTPSENQPIALSIVSSKIGGQPKIFLAQIIKNDGSPINSKTNFLLYSGDFSASSPSVSLKFPNISASANFDFNYAVPYVVSALESGKEAFYCAVGRTSLSNYGYTYIKWVSGEEDAAKMYSLEQANGMPCGNQRISFSRKNKDEAVAAFRIDSGGRSSLCVFSIPSETFYLKPGFGSIGSGNVLNNPKVLNIAGISKLLFSYKKEQVTALDYESYSVKAPNTSLQIPPAARTFVDAGAYLWGKDIYMIFAGTGIIFSRTLEEGSFGYLDTTGVLGTITQFGYLDYSQDENTLYLLGQDTNNHVKVAKMELNTLYDYANDGAWLPMIASDGVPAYIKAKEPDTEEAAT